MAFLNNVTNDVFISYRYLDNRYKDAWGCRCVTEFSLFLNKEVSQRIGDEELKIYFSELDARPNSDFDRLMVEVQSSAIFVAVVSPGYPKDSWALAESKAFKASGRPDDCFYVVEICPLPKGESYPEWLNSKIHMEFWKIGPKSRTPVPLTPPQDPNEYTRLISDLGEQISRRLLELKESGGRELPAQRNHSSRAWRRPTAPKSAPTFGSMSGTVVVAQATDDLIAERDQVCSYLVQSGLTVLPSSEYPQGGDEFKAAITADLKRAELFVQLLGPVPGRKPPDLPEGFTRYQFDAAKSAGTPIFQWRHPDTRPAVVSDDLHRALLMAETVTSSGLESFKSAILERFTKTAAVSSKRNGASMVYIDADRIDLQLAETIRDALKSRQIGVALPVFDGDKVLLRDLEENLKYSDDVIFVYGRAPVDWIRSHLRRFNRTMADRELPPNVVAVYCGPPPDKTELGMDFPYLKLIRCEQSTDIAPLLSLFER